MPSKVLLRHGAALSTAAALAGTGSSGRRADLCAISTRVQLASRLRCLALDRRGKGYGCGAVVRPPMSSVTHGKSCYRVLYFGTPQRTCARAAKVITASAAAPPSAGAAATAPYPPPVPSRSVSYETVRPRCKQLGQSFASRIRLRTFAGGVVFHQFSGSLFAGQIGRVPPYIPTIRW